MWLSGLVGTQEVPGESEALSGGSTQGRNAPLPAPTGRPQGSPAPPSSHRELACFLLAHPFTQHQRRGRTLCVLLTFRNGAVVQECFHQKEILPFVTTGATVGGHGSKPGAEGHMLGDAGRPDPGEWRARGRGGRGCDQPQGAGPSPLAPLPSQPARRAGFVWSTLLK